MRVATTDNKGFTLIEILVAIALLGGLIAIFATSTNFSDPMVQSQTSELVASLDTINSAFIIYVNETTTEPTGLSDTTFAPVYLFPPIAPTGFDKTYGVSGFLMAKRTGQSSPDNGMYLCVKAIVAGPTATTYLAIKNAATKTSTMKYCYNTSCPSVVNMADPSGATTVYATNWIYRN